MRPLRIVIVDDHPLFRIGLKRIFEGFRDIEFIALADCFEQLKDICQTTVINFVLMDANLEKHCGAELTRKIKNLFPTIKVLAFSAHEEEQYIYKMLEAGAAGYVLKSANVEELKKAIKVVAQGKNYFSTAISKQLIQPFQREKLGIKRQEKLTLRELEILNFIIKEELSNKEIADRLFISPRTVETHKRNLIQKLQVKNTIGLAKYYFEYSDTLSKVYGIPLG